jgi:hypothetical protein
MRKGKKEKVSKYYEKRVDDSAARLVCRGSHTDTFKGGGKSVFGGEPVMGWRDL